MAAAGHWAFRRRTCTPCSRGQSLHPLTVARQTRLKARRLSTHQQSLFETAPPPWEADDAAEQRVATVVFPTGPARDFDYLVPDKLRALVEPGRRVRAPFGRSDRAVVGYCLDVADRPAGQRRLKELKGILDEPRLLSPPMMRLAAWIVEHYLATWGQVLEAILPAGVRGQAGTRLVTYLELSPEARAGLAELKLTKKQAQIVAWLAQRPGPVAAPDVLAQVPCTPGPVAALRTKGLIVAEKRREGRFEQEIPPPPTEDHFVPNDDQRAALDAILAALRASRHETLLLHGITGSGKTEVYIHAIQEVVRYGRQAIVLVPEISLTPQTKSRFVARFGRVAVLHSHMSDVERHRQWERIARGDVSVVVGARSAVFAPTPHLGLIVLDEEHETTFKQNTAPRYHAREVALYRARAEGVPLVLGTATPSLETYYKAQRGEFRMLRLPRRVYGRELPDVATIDLRGEVRDGAARGPLSRPLQAAMDSTLADGGQVILLLNRRGFSTHIQCPACGGVVRCPHCEIALTHHRQGETALCHYCDYQIPTPNACPECQYAGIRFSGLGTQRLEAEIKSRFGSYPCLRMDADAMRKHGSHEEALARFRSGEVRILLGTQMIAKGLDFPNVTLVGVISADTALHLPDFRAAERTFQLLVQVAGRTGRGDLGGRVLVQTFSPDHAAIQAAVRHDFDAFARQELPIREGLAYPPAAQMIRLLVRGPQLATAAECAKQIAEGLRAALESGEKPEGGAGASSADAGGRVLGPAPAPLAKLRGLYRFQIHVHGVDGPRLRQAVRAVTDPLKPPEGVQWIADVDPVDML
jgi:primosomal protein N' (replication factor Y)